MYQDAQKKYRASLKGLSLVARIEPESSVSGRLAVYYWAVLLAAKFSNGYMLFSQAL